MERHTSTQVALFFFLCCLLPGRHSATNQPGISPPPQADSVLSSLEVRIFQSVNRYRQAHGGTALEFHSTITEIARLRSRVMAASKTLSHDGFDWAARMLENKTPYEYAAENIGTYWGYEDPARAAIQGWIESEKHRQTMLDKFDLTGVGVAKDSLGTYYFTQLFVRSR